MIEQKKVKHIVLDGPMEGFEFDFEVCARFVNMPQADEDDFYTTHFHKYERVMIGNECQFLKYTGETRTSRHVPKFWI